MDVAGFNVVDLAVLAILVLSAVFAFLRGFVKEVLSVAGWLAAGFVTLYLFPEVQPLARRYIGQTLIADAVAGVALFVISLGVFSVLGHAISARVRESALGPLDRSLGFVFGLVRGVVLVTVAYLLLAWMMPIREQPPWLQNARSVPLIADTADRLLSLLPEDTERRTREAVGLVSGRAREAVQGARMLQRLTLPPPTPSSEPDSSKDSGYKGDERKALDHLFRSNQDR